MMRVAYADPPYIGQAKRHYGKHKDYAGEVNHAELIDNLCADFPDGWALSLSSKSLKRILAMCPEDVRVLAWVKRYHGFLPGVRLQWAWEPVIIRGGRQGAHVKGEHTLRDWVDVSPEGWTFREMPADHVIGKKPEPFCWWLFECLGMRPGDELVDIFPGTGAVTYAWHKWVQQPDLFMRHV